MSKWQKFDDVHNNLQIDKPLMQKNKFHQDWKRSIGLGKNNIFIDGQSLVEVAKNYHNFAKLDDVQNFFQEKILCKMIQDFDREGTLQQNIEIGAFDNEVTYLKNHFYNGGLKNPVSSALAEVLGDEMLTPTIEHIINIKTTNNGFIIQEIATCNNLRDSNLLQINPDQGKNFVLKAEGSINVDFSNMMFNKDDKEPNIKILSNSISYGNSDVKSKMDSRSFGQKIVDFLKNIVGLNKVEILTPEPDNNQLEEAIKQDNAPPKLN